MNITVSVDVTGFKAMHRRLLRQAPFATSRALNSVAKEAQFAQHQYMLSTFTVRRPSFVGRAIKIKPFSTKQSLSVTLLIEPPGGAARADIFAKFEEGGVKRPRGGGRLAIPDKARRSKAGVITRAQRPRAFRFRRVGRGPIAEVFHGDKRTFMIRRHDGGGGIFQRYGRRGGRRIGAIRMLYSFTRSANIDARLGFVARVAHVVQKSWPKWVRTWFEVAIRTAR